VGLTIFAGLVEVNKALHPPRIIPPGNTLRKYNIEYQPVDLITDDGIRLSAWYTPPTNGAVILLEHGYGDNRPESIHALLAKKKYGVLAWDARAHGESEGEISTVGYLEVLDVKAGLDYVLAQYPQIEAVFIDSSFASLEEEFNYLVPYPIINPLAKFIATTQTGLRLDNVNPLNDIAKISPRPVYICSRHRRYSSTSRFG
jgi:pimeloyl-ACP methyl ester carboxylesterase